MEYFLDPQLVILGKLALAALLGMVVGTERRSAGKRAGTRTFALVSMGSALFVIVGINANAHYLGLVNFDPMRTAAAIITGIGFLGAGLIIFRQNALRGLTTSAGLWVSSGLGVAVGFGMYLTAIYATLLTFIIFTVVARFEHRVADWLERFQPTVVDNDMDGDGDPDLYETRP